MAYIQKVWVLTKTIDPYDLQWGVSTESYIIGVFSTIENAQEELDIRRRNLVNVEDEGDNCLCSVYGDSSNGEHVLFEISEHILDYVEH